MDQLMMFPAQTSLIPATVALVRYIEVHGFSGLYPYWYLGTTPVKYLIGPVVPGIIIGLHKIFAGASLFDLSYLILTTSYLILSLGWGLLAWQLSNQHKIGVLVGIISFVLPWHWVSGFALSELSAAVAISLTPWVLLAFARGLGNVAGPAEKISNFKFQISNFKKWLPSLAFALLLLTNSVAAIPVIVGMGILAFSIFNFQFSIFKKLAVVILIGWLIATLWYGPGYWLTIWGAPSLGGRSAFLALGWVIDMFRGLVPFLLAIGVVLVGIRPKDTYSKFAFSWFGVFAVLTLIRFMADPDFWMDWTAWILEVEVGLALLFGKIFARGPVNVAGPAGRFPHPTSSLQSNLDLKLNKFSDAAGARWGSPAPVTHNISATAISREVYPDPAPPEKDHVFRYFETAFARMFTFGVWNLVIGVLLVVGWFWAYQAKDFWLPRKEIEDTAEFRIAKWLEKTVNCQLLTVNCPTVFLSGTTAFWLNSLVDVRQVRGGADYASVDSNWREAAWVIRQGESSDEIVNWTGKLNIDYIVVHTGQSQEFYHDFVNPEIFENASYLSKVYDAEGDKIYRVQ